MIPSRALAATGTVLTAVAVALVAAPGPATAAPAAPTGPFVQAGTRDVAPPQRALPGAPAVELRASAPAVPAAQRVVDLANGERLANGCPALTPDLLLGDVATAHSADMAATGTLGHGGSDGSTPLQRALRAGYRPAAVAENAAAGHATPEDVVGAWLASPGHRANLLDCRLLTAGVGLADSPAGPYWTLVLADPA